MLNSIPHIFPDISIFLCYCSRQSSADKLNKQLESHNSEANGKLEQLTRDVNELKGQKSHAQMEIVELTRQLEESESAVNQLTKTKQSLTKKLDETKNGADEESGQRAKLQIECRNLQDEVTRLKDQVEEEERERSDLQRHLTKANNELAAMQSKLDGAMSGAATAEAEDIKRRLNAKIQEAVAAAEAAQSKASASEKAKVRLQGELEDVTVELEKVSFDARRVVQQSLIFVIILITAILTQSFY